MHRAPSMLAGGKWRGAIDGRTSPETTKRYAHLANDPLRRATEMFGAKVGK